ncbi:MAG: recombinase XerD, partial [Planctomycetota bacterium]|nr:recombinase XerD [Planctomycetota bacterium]
MPKLVQKVPSYRRHRPSGRALVCIDGKRTYIGKWNSVESRGRYKQLIAEWLANCKQPGNPEGEFDLTITELIVRYWRHASRYYRKHGQPTKELEAIRASFRPLRELYGRSPSATFGPLKLKTVRKDMIDARLSRKTVNDRIGRIKRLFKWATANELGLADVFHALQAVEGLKRGRSDARETEPVRPVPDEHVDTVLKYVPRAVAAMIELQRLTGMRSGEVSIMRGCDLDMGGKIWTYTLERHKTEHHGHARIVYLGTRAQKMIQPYLRADLSAYLFSP